jgi:hypothetical protein
MDVKLCEVKGVLDEIFDRNVMDVVTGENLRVCVS